MNAAIKDLNERSRKRSYTIPKPIGKQYQTEIHYTDESFCNLFKLTRWCNANVKKDYWDCFYDDLKRQVLRNVITFAFAREQDRTMFILAWGTKV